MKFNRQKPLRLFVCTAMLILAHFGIAEAGTNWSNVPKFPATGTVTPFDGQWSGELKVKKMMECPAYIKATADVKFGFMVLKVAFEGKRATMWGRIDKNNAITGSIGATPADVNPKVNIQFTNDALDGTFVVGHCSGTFALTPLNSHATEAELQADSDSTPTRKVGTKQPKEVEPSILSAASSDVEISTRSREDIYNYFFEREKIRLLSSPPNFNQDGVYVSKDGDYTAKIVIKNGKLKAFISYKKSAAGRCNYVKYTNENNRLLAYCDVPHEEGPSRIMQGYLPNLSLKQGRLAYGRLGAEFILSRELTEDDLNKVEKLAANLTAQLKAESKVTTQTTPPLKVGTKQIQEVESATPSAATSSEVKISTSSRGDIYNYFYEREKNRLLSAPPNFNQNGIYVAKDGDFTAKIVFEAGNLEVFVSHKKPATGRCRAVKYERKNNKLSAICGDGVDGFGQRMLYGKFPSLNLAPKGAGFSGLWVSGGAKFNLKRELTEDDLNKVEVIATNLAAQLSTVNSSTVISLDYQKDLDSYRLEPSFPELNPLSEKGNSNVQRKEKQHQLISSTLEESNLPSCPGLYDPKNRNAWMNCVGTHTWHNGDKYVGQFKNGRIDGQGTLIHVDGTQYSGAFKDGKRHGQGTYTYGPKSKFAGDKFVGEFKDGKRHGKGAFTFGPKSKLGRRGDNYVGNYKDDKIHGQGTYTYANGSKYVGEFRDDKFNGKGIITLQNGSKFVGEFRDNQIQGKGIFTYANGEKYVGEFRDNEKHGQGTYTFADGRVEKGIWENGEFQTATKTASSPIAIKPSTEIEQADSDTDLDLNQPISSRLMLRSQEALQVLGLYSGALDGIAGSKSVEAIEEWQQLSGLPKTGEITELQLVKLEQEAIQHFLAKKTDPKPLEALRKVKSSQSNPDKYAGINFGKYHALVIGINAYKYLPKLKNAINDARAVSEVLQNSYGFDVTLLRNPNRSEILDAFDDYRLKLGKNDNLLIYYAGHGWLDEDAGRGYWWPVNAREDRRRNWIQNSVITATLKALEARHVMVVADSCFSGTLVRGIKATDMRTSDIRRLIPKRARLALTSGGLEPVLDSAGKNNSPFARAFIDTLAGNDSVLDGTSMFIQLRRLVMLNAVQTPEYSDIRLAGHEGGDFIFVRQR